MSSAPPPDPQVQVDHAENVNVPSQGNFLPYSRITASVTFGILTAFVAVTFWVLMRGTEENGIDAATKGAIIQTWNNLAVAAATFWVGSSLAAKLTKDK